MVTTPAPCKKRKERGTPILSEDRLRPALYSLLVSGANRRFYDFNVLAIRNESRSCATCTATR
jgi:hypothetical protein